MHQLLEGQGKIVHITPINIISPTKFAINAGKTAITIAILMGIVKIKN
jgi:hypothetical protein